MKTDEVFVGGARWRVDDHEIERAAVVAAGPVDVLEELLDHAVLLRTAPDDGRLRRRQHEALCGSVTPSKLPVRTEGWARNRTMDMTLSVSVTYMGDQPVVVECRRC